MPRVGWLREQRKFSLQFLLAALLILTSGAISPGQSLPPEVKPLSSPKVTALPSACRVPQNTTPAIAALVQREAPHPTSKGYNSIGMQFTQAHNFPCAVAAFEIALTMDPKSWETRYNLGLALVRTADRTRAASEFQSVLVQKPDYFPAHSALGLLFYSMDRRDAAADEFKATLRLNPRDAAAAFNLAKVLHAQRRYAAEIYYLRQGLAWEPPAELAYPMRFALGAAYFQNGNKDDALDTLRKLEASYPQAAEVHFTLGNVYAKDLAFQQAAAEYAATIRIDPENNTARLSLGKAYLESGEVTTALPYLQEYTRRAATDYEGHLVLGQAYRRQGQLIEATEEFRRAAELKPDNYDAHYNLGLMLSRSGRTDEAIRELEAARKLKPEAPQASYELGLLFNKVGKPQRSEEALRDFQEAKQVSGQDRTASLLEIKGNDLLVKGDSQGAAAAYREALKLEPDSAQTHYNLSLALEKLGSREEEEGELQKAVELDPNFAEAHNQLGIRLAAKGKNQEAEGEFKIALGINPAYPEAESNLGTVYARRGSLSEATTLFRLAIKNNPAYTQAYVNLALTLASQGKYTDAEEQLNQALKIDPENPSALRALDRVKTQMGKDGGAAARIKK